MSKVFSTLFVLLFCCNVFCQDWQYPPTKTVDVKENLWGVEINDPYRWLENLKDTGVLSWFKQQADFTLNILDQIPGTQVLINELSNLQKMKSRDYSEIRKSKNIWYYSKKMPEELTNKFYMRKGDNGEETMLFDPANFIKGKIFDYDISLNQNTSFLTLNLSEKGKELGDMYLMDLKSRKILPDVFKNAKGYFSMSDSNIIYYIQYNGNDIHEMSTITDCKLMMHTLGTPKESDKIIASRLTNAELNLIPEGIGYVYTFPNSPYIFYDRGDVNVNAQLFYTTESDLKKNKKIIWKPFASEEDEIRQTVTFGSSISARSDEVYCFTTKGNDNGRIIRVNLPNPDFGSAKEIFSALGDWKIMGITQTKDYLIILMSKNGLESKNMKYEFNTGKISELKTPVQGTITPIPPSYEDNDLNIFFTGWTEPENWYHYNLETDQFSEGIFHTSVSYPGVENLVATTIEVPSHDGEMVPLSIIYDKTKMKQDGNNICLLDGYGAYGITLPPSFFYPLLPILQRGVIIATAHVRGGGEKGKNWHLAGQKTTKPNTWKDFNACAEYLIQNKFTSPEKLGCMGGSAGGILIGRAITERPDLYKVAIPMVGCLNALRMEFEPNGPANIPEFGTIKDSVECMALIEMDALHHIKRGVNYPAQLITTGFNDPRVSSWIPAKFAASMQANGQNTNPALLYVNYEAGHSAGTTEEEMIKDWALKMSFLLWQCGHPEFQVQRTGAQN